MHPILKVLPAAILGTCISTSLFASSNQEMRFCYEDQSYLPFIGKVAEKNQTFSWKPGMGVLADLVDRSVQDLGMTARFISLPWKRCIYLLGKGDVDGIFAAIWQPERDEWGVFPKANGWPDNSKRLWRVDYPIYTRVDSKLSWNGRSFSNLNLGVGAPLGYVAHKYLEKLEALPTSDSLPEKGLSLVAKQRLDGYVVETSIGDRIVKNHKIDSAIMKLPQAFLKADWFVPLSHQWVAQHPDLAERFWINLAEHREVSGENLYRQYSQTQEQ